MNQGKTLMTLTGDWRKLRNFLQSEEIFEEMNEFIKHTAEDIREEMKDMIPFDDVPNAPRTEDRKGFNSSLEEEGRLKQYIDVFEDNGRVLGGGQTVYTYTIKGNPDEQVTTPNRGKYDLHHDINYEDLLVILNNGTNQAGVNRSVTIPPRDIFNKVWNKVKHSDNIAKELTFKLEEIVRRKTR